MTKIHHSAQPPHEVCILFNYSRLSTKIWSKILSKSPSQKLYKTSQITCPHRLLTSNLWKHPMHYDLFETCSSQSHSAGYVWRMKDEKNLTWPTIHTIDHVKETRKDCGYRLTKTRWILPLLSAIVSTRKLEYSWGITPGHWHVYNLTVDDDRIIIFCTMSSINYG